MPETNEEYNARVDAHIAAMAVQSGINVGPDTSGMAGPLPSEEQFNAHVFAVVLKEHALPSVGKESTLDVELKVRVNELLVLKRGLNESRTKEAALPQPLWAHSGRLAKALLKPMQPFTLKALDFKGRHADFLSELFPEDFWTMEGKAATARNICLQHALHTVLFHVASADEGWGRQVPSARSLEKGMVWISPPGFSYPDGALAGCGNPLFAETVPLLEFLSEKCDPSDSVGPAATREGLNALKAGWAARCAADRVKVTRETPPPPPRPSHPHLHMQATEEATERAEHEAAILVQMASKLAVAEPALQKALSAAGEAEAECLEVLQGLLFSRLPRAFEAQLHYTLKPIEGGGALQELSFDADEMPSEAEVERHLRAHMLMLIASLPSVPILAYSGIAFDLLKRWRSYMQCRTIFKRCQLLWRLYGSVDVEMATGVECLERLSIKVKEDLLPSTDDGVFGNRLKYGGSGQKVGVLQYSGYLLTLCSGELTV